MRFSYAKLLVSRAKVSENYFDKLNRLNALQHKRLAPPWSLKTLFNFLLSLALKDSCCYFFFILNKKYGVNVRETMLDECSVFTNSQSSPV